jgi:hypothetical protein
MAIISYPKKIKVFFNSVIYKVRNELDPELILIAGSFGKGAWIFDGEELLSDFEFVFIRKKPWSLKKKKKLLAELNFKFPFDISLKGYLLHNVQKKIISNYSFNNPGYIDLPFYDTFSDPQILYSKNNNISYLPILQVTEIPVWEAWRLFVNRLGEILYLCINKTQLDSQKINYHWLKCFESIADAYLIVKKLYDKNISKRIEIFSRTLIKDDSGLSQQFINNFKMINLALQTRSNNNINIFNISHINEPTKLKIINLLLKYIEDKMCHSENLSLENNEYYKSYINNKILQNKYLETNFKNNILLSNLIKLIHYPSLRNNYLKFDILHNSFKHIILLTIVSTFKEYSCNEYNFQISKKIFSILVKRSYLDQFKGNDFVEIVLKYWKICR